MQMLSIDNLYKKYLSSTPLEQEEILNEYQNDSFKTNNLVYNQNYSYSLNETIFLISINHSFNNILLSEDAFTYLLQYSLNNTAYFSAQSSTFFLNKIQSLEQLKNFLILTNQDIFSKFNKHSLYYYLAKYPEIFNYLFEEGLDLYENFADFEHLNSFKHIFPYLEIEKITEEIFSQYLSFPFTFFYQNYKDNEYQDFLFNVLKYHDYFLFKYWFSLYDAYGETPSKFNMKAYLKKHLTIDDLNKEIERIFSAVKSFDNVDSYRIIALVEIYGWGNIELEDLKKLLIRILSVFQINGLYYVFESMKKENFWEMEECLKTYKEFVLEYLEKMKKR